MESLQREIEGQKKEIEHLCQEVRKRNGVIESLKTDIEGLKKEIQERDDTIQDKVCVCVGGGVRDFMISATVYTPPPHVEGGGGGWLWKDG